MKKLLLFIFIFISFASLAQKGISYQAVILDPTKIELPGQDISGQPFVNGNVWVKFSIVSGGTSQFEEVQQTKTDAYGLVNLTIGSVANTAFNALTWDANQKSLQVFVSFDNGATYTKVSDQKLSYSPYALFAETAGKLGSTLSIAGGGTGATTAVGARSNLGLGNVDNTADADKPISTATKAALDLKANVADVNAALALKANVTDLSSLAPLSSPTFTGTVSGIDKSMVGLGSVDNTPDVAKPISTATQAALDQKAPLLSPAFSGVPTAPTASPRTNSTQIATTAYTDAAVSVAMASAGVADNSITTAKIANGAVTDAKIAAVSSAKLVGVIPVTSGGTGQTSITGIQSTLGLLSNNIAIGSQAGTPNQGVNANTVAIGGGAGNSGQGQSAIGIGYVAGYANQGANGIAIGSNTAQSNQSSQAVALGYAAGQYGQGQNSVAIGAFAGNNAQVANSIALNATGASLNPTNAGFYVNPIRTTTATSNVLYYNTSTKEVTSAAGGFVDLTTNQTISAAKTFSDKIVVNGIIISSPGSTRQNTALGNAAFVYGNSNSSNNTAVGHFALSSVQGNSNTAVGENAMRQGSLTAAGSYNVGVGSRALTNALDGSNNVGVGYDALEVATGSTNTGVGTEALRFNTSGSGNVGIGGYALASNTTGSNNTALGNSANVGSSSLTNATAIGNGATVNTSNTIQLGNSSVTSVKTSGIISANGYSIVGGTSTQFLMADGSVSSGGYVDLTTAQTVAGVKTFSSNLNVNGLSIGRGNGNNDESVAIGQGAMGASNVNGKRNTAIGAGTMSQYNGTSWDNNTAVGYRNMPSLTSGSGNTSVGAESMLNLLTGTENTSIGNQSLINVTGNNNVGVGKRSGQTITSGGQNTIIGTDADVSSATLSNASALGYGAQVTASNSIQLGNSSVTNVKTSGTITAGAVTYPNTNGTPGQVLTANANGTSSWQSITTKTYDDWPFISASNLYQYSGYIIATQHGSMPDFPEDLPDGFTLTICNYSNFTWTSNVLTNTRFYTNSSGNGGVTSFSINPGAAVNVYVITTSGQKRYYIK